MKDHTKPFLRRKPDELIIHVGTNTLRSCNTPCSCLEEVIDLATYTMVSSESTAKIAISRLVNRSDDEALGRKIADVNKVLEQFCNQYNWGFIDHTNISANSH